jgi:hypothetical protein
MTYITQPSTISPPPIIHIHHDGGDDCSCDDDEYLLDVAVLLSSDSPHYYRLSLAFRACGRTSVAEKATCVFRFVFKPSTFAPIRE